MRYVHRLRDHKYDDMRIRLAGHRVCRLFIFYYFKTNKYNVEKIYVCSSLNRTYLYTRNSIDRKFFLFVNKLLERLANIVIMCNVSV